MTLAGPFHYHRNTTRFLTQQRVFAIETIGKSVQLGLLCFKSSASQFVACILRHSKGTAKNIGDH